MAKKGIVRNGFTKTNTGRRTLVFKPNGEIRPVLFCVRNGLRSDRCTVQTTQTDDLVIDVQYRHNQYTVSFDRVKIDDNDNVMFEEIDDQTTVAQSRWEEVKGIISSIMNDRKVEEKYHADLLLFFEEAGHGRGEAFLPDGIGWSNGLALSDKEKLKRATEFFEPLILTLDKKHQDAFRKQLFGEIERTPNKDLWYDWGSATGLPDEATRSRKINSSSLCAVDQDDMWFIRLNGNWEFFNVQPTSFDSRVQRKELHYTSEGTKFPEGTERAVKVSLGAYLRNTREDHFTYGVKVSLFKTY